MKTALHCGLTIRLYREEKVFGPGVAQLLETIDQTHSLRSAAMQMNMAYSKAWKVIKAAEEGFATSLLDTAVGGKRGGGATLTPAARDLLQRYRAFERECKEQAEIAYRRYFVLGDAELPTEDPTPR